MRSFHAASARHYDRGRAGRLGVRAALAALVMIAATLMTGGSGALAASPCGATGQFSQSGTTASCTYTNPGSEDAFTVPAGISAVSVTAIGALGGSGTNGGSSTGSGGLGARVSNASLPVTPGAGLFVDVGGPGSSHTTCTAGSVAGGSFDGGASGFCSGAGGGSSALLTAARASATLTGNVATDSRLLVAGGGGGGAQILGGASAGDSAVTGAGAGGCLVPGSAGGVGPTDGTDGGGPGGSCGGTSIGTAGTAANGGTGASTGAGGGGGGGGWFSGGGGGSGGSGGGGSSYGGAGPSGGISIATASSSDAPEVVIGWTPLYNLTVSLAGSGSGSVTASPAGIDCGANCQHAYAGGTTVTLTASPAAGSTFAGWSGGGCSGTGTCTIAMNADTTVTATFNASHPPASHTLTARLAGRGKGSVSDGTGAISCPSACSHAYTDGTRVTLHASAAKGSRFAGFSGGGCSGTNPCTVTVSADTTVTATFAKNAPKPAHLRITHVDARAPQAGCATELAFLAAIIGADCNRARITVTGTINKLARGKVHVTVTVNLGGRPRTVAGAARIDHGRWKLTLTLPATDRDLNPPAYTINARFTGNHHVRPARALKRLALEVEPPGLGPT